jgi:hypothetical protein
VATGAELATATTLTAAVGMTAAEADAMADAGGGTCTLDRPAVDAVGSPMPVGAGTCLPIVTL